MTKIKKSLDKISSTLPGIPMHSWEPPQRTNIAMPNYYPCEKELDHMAIEDWTIQEVSMPFSWIYKF